MISNIETVLMRRMSTLRSYKLNHHDNLFAVGLFLVKRFVTVWNLRSTKYNDGNPIAVHFLLQPNPG